MTPDSGTESSAQRAPLSRGSYVRAVSSILGSSAVAQVAPLLLIPFLTRVYGPDGLFPYFLWAAVTLPLSVIAGLRLDVAVLTAPSDAEMKRTLGLSCLVNVMLGVVFSAGAVLFYSLEWMTSSQPVVFGIAIGVGAGLLAMNSAFFSVLNYRSRYSTMAWQRLVQTGALSLAQLACLIFAFSPIVLVYTQIFALIVSNIVLALSIRQRHDLPGHALTRSNWIPQDLAPIRRYIMYSTPADLVNSMTTSIPVILLGSRASTAAASNYALVVRTIGVPVTLLARSFGAVFRGEAASEYRTDGSCRGAYKRVLKSLVLIGVPSAIVLWLVSPFVIPLLFGEGWEEATIFIQIMIPAFLVRMIASTLSYTFFIAQRQLLDLVWQVCFFLGSLIPFFVTTNPTQMVLFYAAVVIAFQLVSLGISWHLAGGSKELNDRSR